MQDNFYPLFVIHGTQWYRPGLAWYQAVYYQATEKSYVYSKNCEICNTTIALSMYNCTVKGYQLNFA